MSVHSWQICVKKMCISKGISYIRQNAENLYKGAAWNLYKRDKVVFAVSFSNNFRFTSYKYVTFGFHKVHRPTYLIVISTDDLAPNRPQIRIWHGILKWINQLTATDLNMLARIWRHQCILFHFFVIIRFFFSGIARLCSFIIDTFLFCT